MRGEIVVMAPAAYEDWLDRQPLAPTLAARGAELYRHPMRIAADPDEQLY